MAEADEKTRIHRGLKDVLFERSPTTHIDGRAGVLLYRGYSIHDLAVHSNFEETAYLLLKGALPTQPELEAFDAELKSARHLPDAVYEIIRLTCEAHPMTVLRTAVTALGGFEP